MKYIAYLLVAVNLMTFAWLSQHQESHPGSSKTPAPATTIEGVSSIQLLSELDPVIKVAAREQLPSQTTGKCHSVGPFKNHAAAKAALGGMEDRGITGTLRRGRANVRIGYWVHLKSMQDPEIKSVINVLQKNGINDYHRNENNELSLGIYNRQEDAERRKLRIAALGYSPLAGPLYRDRNRYWIDVAEENKNMLTDDAWDVFLAGYPDSRRQSMTCKLINA